MMVTLSSEDNVSLGLETLNMLDEVLDRVYTMMTRDYADSIEAVSALREVYSMIKEVKKRIASRLRRRGVTLRY
jgi:hypothetical protein